MKTDLIQLQQRIIALEKLAGEVLVLAYRQSLSEKVQPELSVKGQRWYRGARELLVQNNFSGISEFDKCYDTSDNKKQRRSFTDIEAYIEVGTNAYKESRMWNTENQGKEYFGLFQQYFQKARALLLSLNDEIASRELPIKSQLSFSVAADEFSTARAIFDSDPNEEISLRVAGFITRIALERHLLTVANARSIEIEVNPKHKKSPDTNDILTTLAKASIINSIQKSELESLFKIGHNCAHPREAIQGGDVNRLITRAHELSSIIL